MSIKGQRHSLNLAKGHPDFKVKCLTLACILRWAIQGLMALLLYLLAFKFSCSAEFYNLGACLSKFLELADLEAKSALSLSITNLRIPHSDFKSNIHQYVMNKCQSVWEEQTGNKLHELKPDFNGKCSFLGYSREIQTKITRCRIGHTRLTHSYLLTNEQPPFCISCNEPFTVKHFLITCTEFNYIRNRYFTAKTVKELFTDTSSDKIINFKETNLFNKL